MILLLLQNRHEQPGLAWENCYSCGMLRPIIEAMGSEDAYVRMQADLAVYGSPTSCYKVDVEEGVRWSNL